jgi:hypothetical protein
MSHPSRILGLIVRCGIDDAWRVGDGQAVLA